MNTARKVARAFLAEQQDLPFAEKMFDDAAGDFWHIDHDLGEHSLKSVVEAAAKPLQDAAWDLGNGKVSADKVPSYVKQKVEEADHKLHALEQHLQGVLKKVSAIRADLQKGKSKF